MYEPRLLKLTLVEKYPYCAQNIIRRQREVDGLEITQEEVGEMHTNNITLNVPEEAVLLITFEQAEFLAHFITMLDEKYEKGVQGLKLYITGIQHGLSPKRALAYTKRELKKSYEATRKK